MVLLLLFVLPNIFTCLFHHESVHYLTSQVLYIYFIDKSDLIFFSVKQMMNVQLRESNVHLFTLHCSHISWYYDAFLQLTLIYVYANVSMCAQWTECINRVFAVQML